MELLGLLLTLLIVLALAGLPVLAIGALVGRLQRTRAHVIAQQIALTDAIHAELGAVAAPVVAKPVFGPWRVTFAVPFGRPALVEPLVAITGRVLAAASPAGVRIVLTPRADVPRARAA